MTHDGVFHAGEAFSYAALGLAFPGRQVDFVRSCDPGEIASADIVFGVGDQYDPQRRRFDHHQKDRLIREGVPPSSSFGLIWHHLGLLVISSVCPDVDIRVATATWIHVDATLVHQITLGASGFAGCPRHARAGMLDVLNLLRGEDAYSDHAFLRAAGLAETRLRRDIATAASRARATGHSTDTVRVPGHPSNSACRTNCTRARVCRPLANRITRASA